MIIDVLISRAILDHLVEETLRLRVVSDLFIKEIVDKTVLYLSACTRAVIGQFSEL